MINHLNVVHMKPSKKPDPEIAKRALAEAKKRRENLNTEKQATELHGRDGPDPVRYGDWENKGIASDF